jgi:hypothetical protein
LTLQARMPLPVQQLGLSMPCCLQVGHCLEHKAYSAEGTAQQEQSLKWFADVH